MTVAVVALYQFAKLPDPAARREPLLDFCHEKGLRGTLLLAEEGINGTIAGTAEAVEELLDELARGPLFEGRLGDLRLRRSSAATMPFRRMKVKLKQEIVTLGRPDVDPSERVGTYVEPEDWNTLIRDPETLVIDARNRFEFELGTFERATDPETRKFSQFPGFVARALDPARHRRIAMFCTGGIRCEKASSLLLAEGFAEVYHLKGGILRYLEEVPAEESLWRGECFVFDERVALGHGLRELRLSTEDGAEADPAEV